MKKINYMKIKRIICFLLSAALVFVCFTNDHFSIQGNAEEVEKITPEIDVSYVSGFYYGETYNIADYIQTNSDGVMTFKYAPQIDEWGDNFGEETDVVPTEVGRYRVYVYLTETDTYNALDDYSVLDYEIKYLTKSDDSDMDAEIESTPAKTGDYEYFDSPVTIKAEDGYEVSVQTESGDMSEFADSYTIQEDGYYNGLYGFIRRKSDNATSAYITLDSTAFYIDSEAPHIMPETIQDQDGNVPDTAIEDGAVIKAKQLKFTIYDEGNYLGSLQSITVNGENVPRTDVNGRSVDVTLVNDAIRTSFDIEAVDYLDHTLKLGITLEYKNEPETSIEQGDCLYGTALGEPVVTTDSDQVETEYKYYYKKSGSDDSTYSSEAPSEAGDYVIKVVIPESENCYESSATDTFSIKYLTTPSDPYSVSGTEGENGYYKSDVSLVAKEGYKIGTSINGTFESSVKYDSNVSKVWLKRDSDGAITDGIAVNKLLVDKEFPEVSLATDQNGDSYELKDGAKLKVRTLSFEITDDNLSTVTVNGKSYDINSNKSKVKLTIPKGSSDTYTIIAKDKAGNTTKLTLNIEYYKKLTPKSKLSVSDSFVGDDYKVTFETDSDGKDKASIQYKKNDEEDSTYSSKKPTKAGSYTVRVKIPETGKYLSGEYTDSFTIKKHKVNDISLTVKDIYVGETIKPVLKTDSDGIDKATYMYKSSGAEDYTSDKPVAAGIYSVKVIVPATDKYEEASCTAEFSIKRFSASASISLGTIYAGTIYTPELKTNSDGANGAIFSYKQSGASDDKYSESRPVFAGKYTARVILPATGKYEGVTATVDFEIEYLNTPANPFSPSGKKGKNEFYTTDVSLSALGGYLIGTSLTGEFSSEIPYSENMGAVYLKRISDGALTDAINVNEHYKIDKNTPSILPMSGTAGGVYDGASTYADIITMNVADDNLSSVTLNGEKVSVSNGKAQAVLNSANGVKSFTIVAEDKAGNQEEFAITLKAEWLKNKIIPANKLLPLDNSESYKLGDGTWTVDGDPTVYSGGRSVYVKDSGDYTFSN